MASQGGVVTSVATCFLLLLSKATSSPHNTVFNLPASGTEEVKWEEVSKCTATAASSSTCRHG